MVEQVEATHTSSYNHIKITTKLYNNQDGKPTDD